MVNKINIALEYPKILLIYLSSIQIKKIITKILKITMLRKNHNLESHKRKDEYSNYCKPFIVFYFCLYNISMVIVISRDKNLIENVFYINLINLKMFINQYHLTTIMQLLFK